MLPVVAVAGLFAPPTPARASPPAGWTPDEAGWAQPLRGAQAALAAKRADRAAVWLSLIPPDAITRRARNALALELAVQRRDEADIRRLVERQLRGCLPLEDAPWAEHAVLAIIRGVASATAAWSVLESAPFVPASLRAFEARSAPAFVLSAVRARALVEAPDDPRVKAIRAQLDIAGLVAVLPELERRVARAEALLDAHVNDVARREAITWLETHRPPPNTECRLAYVAGRAARKSRRYSEALRWLERARHACEAAGDLDRRMKAMLIAGQVHRILSNPSAIRRLYREARRLAPDHSFVDDLAFLEADALEGAVRTRLAARRYEALVESHPDGDMVPDAAWRRARALLDDRPREARAWLDRVVRTTAPASRDHERALYWRARLDERDRPDAALEAFEALFRRMGYYGLLARARLAALEASKARAVERELLEAVTRAPTRRAPREPAFAAARAVAERLGEAWGRAQLEAAACGAEAGRRFAIARALVALDHHGAAQRVLRPVQDDFLGDVAVPSLVDWRTAYSRPHPEAVRAAARSADIDPWLLWGVAREESTFDADIISWAGAIGLTQLMPPTAMGAHAAVFREPLADLESLTDPALNLRLGAHVLSEGFRRWKRAPLAISAYNAGSGLTARFVAQSPSRSLDRWVESISVPQTRGYVKRVLESWGRYRLLYAADGARFLPLPLRIDASRHANARRY